MIIGSNRLRSSFKYDDQRYVLLQFYNQTLLIEILKQKQQHSNQQDTHEQITTEQANHKTYDLYFAEFCSVPKNLDFIFNTVDRIYEYLAKNHDKVSIFNENVLQFWIQILKEKRNFNIQLTLKNITSLEEISKRQIIILQHENIKRLVEIENYKKIMSEKIHKQTQATEIQRSLRRESEQERDKLIKELEDKKKEKTTLENMMKKKERQLMALKEQEGKVVNID